MDLHTDGVATTRPPLVVAPLLALSLGYFLVMLDVTVVTVAVPEIQRSLGATPAGLQWAVDGYSTIFAALLLLGGGLGDRLGHRRIFLTGMGVFTAASVVCAVAPDTALLITGRLLQGAGAALLVPTSLALLAAAYPDRTVRARALGFWAGVAGVAFAAGPVVGGVLVSGLSWRAVFWINLPIAVLGVVLTRRHVPAPPKPDSGRRVDVVGQVLAIAGLGCVAAALNEAGSAGWTSTPVLGAFVVGALALVTFVVTGRNLERRGRSPLLPPSLFRHAGFAATAAVGVLLNLGYYGMLYLSTLYFQNQRGFDAMTTGLVLLPTVCMALIAAPLSGRLTARFGPYRPMAGALLLGAAGFVGWLAAGPDTPYTALLFALVATGLATPMTVPAATAAIIESAPAEHAGVASAVFNVSRQIGNAVGVALFGTLAVTLSDPYLGLHISAVIAAVAFAAAAALAFLAGRIRTVSC
ncbi:DHA2 family efflux MFS transporter permease subunit [Amycolatopsis alba]|uniref:MFS transporter n=1 Tax=Amycolatopsis alba DSM 44262 TaxID=1125972 RepID=A0A229REX2_AMYAL|nr:DHA2 family efflux MFS transporter permease subunit [Amycolatopsis alba]OXM45222.1 MFS transporter [Amycolatopsis alba DSM 44262]